MKDPKGPVKAYKSPEEIAKKHNVSLEKIMQQVKMGTKVEGEHTTSKSGARITALQHVDEFPDYYTRLKKVEKIKESEETTIPRRTRKPSQIKKTIKLKYLLNKMENKPKDTKESLETAKMGLEGKRYCRLCRKAETQQECSFGPEMWNKFSIATVHPTNEEFLDEKRGLWDIHARRKAGKPPKKPGEKGYPKTLDIGEDHKEIASGKMKDEEGYMANIEMDKIERSVEILRKIVKSPNMQLPAWVQSKITRAADFIDTAAEYLSSDKEVSEACWTGYKQVGMKKKGKKVVPNCVPAEDTCMTFSKFMHIAEARKKIKISTNKPIEFKIADIGPEKKEYNITTSKGWKDIKEVAAWQRKEGKNPEGGLNEKGRKSYERENPGSNLQAPQPEGGPRKRSFCARMGGMPGPMKDEKGRPTRKALSLRKWKC